MRRWVSPFGHPRIDIWKRFPVAYRSVPTSFIGFRRQGIHRWLFVAWRTKMLVLAMEFSKGRQNSQQSWLGFDGTNKRPTRKGGHCRSTGRRPVPGMNPENGTEVARSAG